MVGAPLEVGCKIGPRERLLRYSHASMYARAPANKDSNIFAVGSSTCELHSPIALHIHRLTAWVAATASSWLRFVYFCL